MQALPRQGVWGNRELNMQMRLIFFYCSAPTGVPDPARWLP